jgi:hypothetical protein
MIYLAKDDDMNDPGYCLAKEAEWGATRIIETPG